MSSSVCPLENTFIGILSVHADTEVISNAVGESFDVPQSRFGCVHSLAVMQPIKHSWAHTLTVLIGAGFCLTAKKDQDQSVCCSVSGRCCAASYDLSKLHPALYSSTCCWQMLTQCIHHTVHSTYRAYVYSSQVKWHSEGWDRVPWACLRPNFPFFFSSYIYIYIFLSANQISHTTDLPLMETSWVWLTHSAPGLAGHCVFSLYRH